MTKVKIEPGICGFTALVTAEDQEDDEIKVHVATGCEAIKKMMEDLGDMINAFDVCLKRPGAGLFYEYAAAHFPAHAACPVIAGITKAIEAEDGLALKKDASITFVEA